MALSEQEHKSERCQARGLFEQRSFRRYKKYVYDKGDTASRGSRLNCAMHKTLRTTRMVRSSCFMLCLISREALAAMVADRRRFAVYLREAA